MEATLSPVLLRHSVNVLATLARHEPVARSVVEERVSWRVYLLGRGAPEEPWESLQGGARVGCQTP